MSDARVAYNVSQAGKGWKVVDLPAPLNTLDPATPAFADAVVTLQKAKGVAADGKLGPGTLAALKAPAAPKVDPSDCGSLGNKTPITEAALALISTATAEADKGVREAGKNAGADVEKYQKCVGIPKGAPWCAAFVSWCHMAAKGLSKPAKWCSGSAVSLYQVASNSKTCVKVTPADADFQSKVKPGMVWSRAQDSTAAAAARKGKWCQGHTGIVVKVDSVGFHTIEGNTNAAGSREGDGVYRKTHKWTDAEIIGKTVGWFDPETV
jgi:hypothetical protein